MAQFTAAFYNPACCDCERCEIDRERAPHRRAWLTAFHEATTAQVGAALDAVESGSHRDSPEANGALLALTGLMLDVQAAVAGDEPDVSEYLLRDSEFDTEFATRRQARAIITTARRQGLDSVKLAKLAAAMGQKRKSWA